MLDYDSLVEYENRELEIIHNNININDRLNHLKKPLVYITGSELPVWGQIPFTGTSVIPIHPVPEEAFEAGYHISRNEIDDLVKFSKDTKKVQFVLTGNPTSYIACDYLEPIISELTPPLYGPILEVSKSDIPNIEDYLMEFQTIVKYSMHLGFLRYSSSGKEILKDIQKSYVCLKLYGFSDITDHFEEYIVIDPSFATEYLHASYDLLIHPLLDPLQSDKSIDQKKITRMHELFNNLPNNSDNKIYFPEIGNFLFKKLTHYPISLEACKMVIHQYDENDLYNVYTSLSSAIREQDSGRIIELTPELEAVLDNIWQDTKEIKNNSTMFEFALNVSGGLFGFLISGYPGLIASLIASSGLSSKYLSQFSEYIAKKVTVPCMVNIYDFQGKYRLK